MSTAESSLRWAARPAAGGDDVVLSVQNLCIEYGSAGGGVPAVRGVSFDLHQGESLALIGESGSGKTTLGLGLVRLLARGARVSQGRIIFRGGGKAVQVLSLSDEQMRQFRWEDCAMVFQGAQNAFNPVLTIRDQFVDTARAHRRQRSKEIAKRAVQLLEFVQLDPERVLRSYPHELSGGMRQRVLIALSLLLEPDILILDEPTTALDILTQRAIIEVLRRLKEQLGFAMIFISHDLALAAELADRVATMYAGRLVEVGPVKAMFYRPTHPYTAALLDAVPTIVAGEEQLVSIPGSPPDLRSLPSGCPFHPRCSYAIDRCREEDVRLMPVAEQQEAACIRWHDVQRLNQAPGAAVAPLPEQESHATAD